jgi:hypothetical protein
MQTLQALASIWGHEVSRSKTTSTGTEKDWTYGWDLGPEYTVTSSTVVKNGVAFTCLRVQSYNVVMVLKQSCSDDPDEDISFVKVWTRRTINAVFPILQTVAQFALPGTRVFYRKSEKLSLVDMDPAPWELQRLFP